MKKLYRAFILLAAALAISADAQVVTMQPLATFGSHGDGSLQPGDHPFLTSASQFQRGMAYNPTTGNLLVVDRSTNSTQPNCDVYVLNGDTGAFIKKLDNGSILSGGNASFAMNLIGVADDGAIYVANLSNGTDVNNPQVRLYRWDNEDAGQTFVFPTGPGVADPGNGVDTNVFQKRWGDTLAVRGSGTNTQVLLANRGTLASIFMPTDSSMAAFAPHPLTSDAGTGSLGFGITFGAGDTFWGTAGANTNGPLYQMQFNLTAGTATKLRTLASPNFPGTITPIFYMPSSNLFAGITMVAGADIIRLYNFSNPDSPVLQDRKAFVTTNNNNTLSGALALGTNGVLYALDSDNGIMAFALTNAVSNDLPPSLFLNPAGTLVLAGNTVTLNSAADGTAPISYQWLFGGVAIGGATNASLVMTNVQMTNAGSYSVIVSNAFGTVTSSTGVLNVVAVSPTTQLVYDPFTNAASATIAGQNNWSLGTGTSAVGDAGSLTYNGLADSVGNKITWGSATMTLQRTNFSVLAGSIYASFLYQLGASSTVPAVGNSGGAIAGFQNNTEGSTYYSKLIVRTNAAAPASYFFGISKRGSETQSGFATNVLSLGQTVFVVSRYTYNPNSSTDDGIDLWINPDPSTFGASNAPPPSVGMTNGAVLVTGVAQADTGLIDRFTFRQSSGPSRTYADEMRIGLAWSDVTAVAAPATPPTLTVARSGSDIVVTWPATYTGYILQGTSTLASPSWGAISYSTSGTNNTATLPAGTGTQFVRLQK